MQKNRTLKWMQRAWQVYRNLVEQKEWQRARDYIQGFMSPISEWMGFPELLVASSAISTYRR